MFTTWTSIIHLSTQDIYSGTLLVVHIMDKGEHMNNAISVLQGAVSIQAVYERVLNGKGADFVCLSTGYEAVIGDWYDKVFEDKLFGSKVTTREVVADTEGNRSYGQKKDGVKNQARYLTDSAESDLVLGDDFMAIISFNPSNPYAVVIEDLSIVSSAKVWFEAIWASAAR